MPQTEGTPTPHQLFETNALHEELARPPQPMYVAREDFRIIAGGIFYPGTNARKAYASYENSPHGTLANLKTAKTSTRSMYAQVAMSGKLQIINGEPIFMATVYEEPIWFKDYARVGLLYDDSQAVPYEKNYLTDLLQKGSVEIQGEYGIDYVLWGENYEHLQMHEGNKALGIALKLQNNRYAVTAENPPITLSNTSPIDRSKVKEYHRLLQQGQHKRLYIVHSTSVLDLGKNNCAVISEYIKIGKGEGKQINSPLFQGKDTFWEVIFEIELDEENEGKLTEDDYNDSWAYIQIYPQEIPE